MERVKDNMPTERTEESFDIAQPLSYMQRGLPAAYTYTDFIYVVENWTNADKFTNLGLKGFREDLSKIIIGNLRNYEIRNKNIKDDPQIPQLLICSFDTSFWNTISSNKISQYKPAWNDPDRTKVVHPQMPSSKKQFFKFDVKILFQIKKNKKGNNPLTASIEHFLRRYDLSYQKIEGESKSFCEASNSILAGRFDDSVEKPKDPYTFYLHCLLGYEEPQHLGGTFVIAQKCILDWNNIHAHNQSLSGVIGRNDILNGSSIFSQHHCPKSHIRISRIKGNDGNPVSPYRDSKTFTTWAFNAQQERGITDNIDPQEGLYFIAYHKNPLLLEKMILSQLGNNAKASFEDSLLSLFRVQNGNILYTPNAQQLTDLNLFALQNGPDQLNLPSLSAYHQINWLKRYKKKLKDEERQKQTNNPYYLYSRAGYMVKMSSALQGSNPNPPSSKSLRILSKTYQLWQDTWYYDRRQKELEHLTYFLQEMPEVIVELEEHANELGFTFNKYRSSTGQWKYESIPMGIRNGVAIHYTLGHVLSTFLYGCRGPVDGTANGCFGANTFHLQPEDVLAGGETNCTFGQGKHLIEYLTMKQKQTYWKSGLNLSAHSGIGHVVPYMEDIMNEGLANIITKFKNEVKKYSSMGADSKVDLFISTVFALLGMQDYFINYANYARNLAESLKPTQCASINSLRKIEATMRHLSTSPPRDLHEGAQLVLSTYICLHISGEPISIGRLDYVLRRFAKPIDPNATEIILSQQDQDIIDSFWIKVGEKPNFNKSFFEDHSKFGNLAMGGSSGSYPQGASFNQWGQQLTVGGSNPDNTPFYNSITVHCLRAARTIPCNAPCLGLRLFPSTPKIIIQEAAKAILAGGAHPIFLNQEKVIEGFRQSGNYVIDKQRWDSVPLLINGEVVDVPYSHWNTTIKEEHIRDYSSDGCHEFLISGRSWFWLGGDCTLKGLEHVLNCGHSLLQSGFSYIHGMKNIYRESPVSTFQTYQQLEQEFFTSFEDLESKGFYQKLSRYGTITKVCPASLLNAFTASVIERGRDFYDNGTEYKLFCPQYTAISNLVNSLWNIKKLVFERKVTNLEEIRFVLLVNWGDELGEPFVSASLPENMRQRLKNRCDMLRELVWKEPKFGLDKEVTEFGLRITRRLSQMTRNIFENPEPRMLQLFKRLTYQHGSANAPFGFQYMPGTSTFENFVDFGASMGASFDGRKKGQSLAQDFSPQNYLMDKIVGDKKYDFKPIQVKQIIENYTYQCGKQLDPQMFSGAPLDVNIDENYDCDVLVKDLTSIALGKGTNVTTFTCCNRETMEDFRKGLDRDLIRLRMGGWSQFAVSMFGAILEQHVRRVREIPSTYSQPEEEKYLPRQETQQW